MHLALNKPSFTLEVIKRLLNRIDNFEINRMFKYRDDNNLMDCISSKEDCCCRVFYSSTDFRI